MNILIVDDEKPIRELCADFLARLGHATRTAEDAETAIAQTSREACDLALLDICMPGMDGLTLLRRLREAADAPSVIMITGHGTMDMAIHALRLGASDFLRKPINLLELEAAVLRCESLRRCSRTSSVRRKGEAVRGAGCAGTPAEFVGQSEATREAVRQIRLAAESGCQNLLLYGETGTGKEVAARMFYQLRCGTERPFVAVNCPALPDHLFESELLGHIRGAFTGAFSDRPGAFELADGGVLFLDEVADLSMAHQAKLLRVLETRLVQRIGERRERQVSVAVVAASNRSLEKCVEDGLFRADLFFRLNSFSVTLQPLRSRLADLEPLACHFLAEYARRVGLPAPEISAEAIRLLQRMSFPGNARELRNMIERAGILARGGPILPEHVCCGSLATSKAAFGVPESAARPAPSCAAAGEATSSRENPLLPPEADVTLEALRRCGWNRRKAAQHLQISYEALRWRIRKYALSE